MFLFASAVQGLDWAWKRGSTVSKSRFSAKLQLQIAQAIA